MVNEDIITSLRNGIERGESLEKSKQILINSGYSIKDVEEASKYVGGTSYLEPRSEDHLILPEKKPLIPELKPLPKIPYPKKFPVYNPPSKSPILKEIEQINPPRQSYLKEIILLIILIILIGILAATIIFKNQLIAFFA